MGTNEKLCVVAVTDNGIVKRSRMFTAKNKQALNNKRKVYHRAYPEAGIEVWTRSEVNAETNEFKDKEKVLVLPSMMSFLEPTPEMKIWQQKQRRGSRR